ncbi:hypothetical protein A3752_02785 [Oleiphilus sp. HI0081]|nr:MULTISPECIES: class I SAM-dependent methyltransferase [unclassified Oleiphilus]KZZ30047.1 hypothetical protein A3752_02785 [Oleiphilus sp. HI0081]
MKEGTYLEEVRQQYENYPYPARDPANEKTDLYVSKPCSLDCLNYYAFEGKRDFTQSFRVLVAGGGTGDDVIYLAEQLRETEVEVVYLDMSQASMDIAKERAKVRKLKNITWIHDSLLNLNKQEYGEFDFISCTGVLHHLKNPDEGLKALTKVLHPDGAMYLMVYATIGRTGIYQMQELMRQINTDTPNIQDCIDNTKKTLNGLPQGNWFSSNKVSCKKDLSTDIGIYDLLIHSQDRAYTVNEMYDYVENAGLKLNKLYNPDHPLGDMIFYPETYIRDPELLNTIKQLPLRKQQSICELLFGQIMKQCCFVSFKETSTPSIKNTDLVPAISTIYGQNERKQNLLKAFSAPGNQIQLNQMFTLKRNPHSKALFEHIDGKRSLKEVVEQTIKTTKSHATFETVFAELCSFVEVLIKLDMMYLREKSASSAANINNMMGV